MISFIVFDISWLQTKNPYSLRIMSAEDKIALIAITPLFV